MAGALKAGERIALELEEHIASQRLAIGVRLGTEEDLAIQFETSRWVMREAIAIAELDGLVESRRGIHGGLFTSAPDTATNIAVLRHYISLSGTTASDILKMRSAINMLAWQTTAARLSLPDVTTLRELAKGDTGDSSPEWKQDVYRLFRKMLELSGNPALSAFAIVLAQANIDVALWNGASPKNLERFSELTYRERVRQVEAIIADDVNAMRACEHRVLEAGLALHAQCKGPPATVQKALTHATWLRDTYLVGSKGKAKKPEALARLIAQRSRAEQLSPGDRIGSEAELMSRFEVGRGVLREAMRTLERYGIAEVLRGKDGGLHVVRPNPRMVVRSAQLLLGSPDPDNSDAMRLLSRILETEAVDRAVAVLEGQNGERAAEIDQVFLTLAEASSQNSQKGVHDLFYRILGQISESPLIDCMIQILHDCPDQEGGFAVHACRSSWQGKLASDFVAALVAGDRSLARRLAIEMSKSSH